MSLTEEINQELLDLIEDIKMQDEAFKNLKSMLNSNLASLQVKKVISLYECSPQHLTRFAKEGDMKGMRNMVNSRKALIEFIIKKTTSILRV